MTVARHSHIYEEEDPGGRAYPTGKKDTRIFLNTPETTSQDRYSIMAVFLFSLQVLSSWMYRMGGSWPPLLDFTAWRVLYCTQYWVTTRYGLPSIPTYTYTTYTCTYTCRYTCNTLHVYKRLFTIPTCEVQSLLCWRRAVGCRCKPIPRCRGQEH